MLIFVQFLLTPTYTEAGILGAAGHIILTDTSELVVSFGAQNMVTVQSGVRTSNLLITGARAYQLL
jgi:hypothetical protein